MPQKYLLFSSFCNFKATTNLNASFLLMHVPEPLIFFNFTIISLYFFLSESLIVDWILPSPSHVSYSTKGY